MRHRVDVNQKLIVDFLRKIGASVFVCSQTDNFVDLVVGYKSKNYLLEIKTKSGKLRDSQKKFMDDWRGCAHVVRSIDDVLLIIKSGDQDV